MARQGVVASGAVTDGLLSPDRLPLASEERKVLGVVTGSHTVQHLYAGGLAITYPFVVADFHVSYATLGIILAVSGVLGGAMQGAAGLVKKASARVLLAGQNIALACCALAGSAAPSFAAFGGARVAGSLSSWPQHPVGSAYLSERFPKRRGTVLSWHTTGGTIGTLIVPLATAGVIAVAGWRWALVVLAVPMAIGGIVVALRLPLEGHHSHGDHVDDHLGTPTEAAADAAPGEAPAAPAKTAAWRQLTRRKVAAVLAASVLAAAGRGLGVISAYVPAYLRSHLHLSIIGTGAIFDVVALGGVIGPLVAGAMSDRIGRKPMLLLSYLGGAVALVAFVYVGAGPLELALVGVVMGALAYSESPLLQSLFSDALGETNVRSAFAWYFAIAYGVGAAWLAIIGVIISDVGFTAAFWTMGISFVGAGAVVALAA